MTHARKTLILKISSEILIGFGLLMFLSLWTPLSHVMSWFLDLAILPAFDGAQSFAATETRLLIAICGGICVGWGVMYYLIVAHVFEDNPKLGRKLILTPIIAWFCVDSLGSVLAGAPFNAVLNLSFLFMFAVPVLWPSREPAAQSA